MDCQFEFGYDLLTPLDELVAVRDVERFCLALRAHHSRVTAEALQREARVALRLHAQLGQHLFDLHARVEHAGQTSQRRLEAVERKRAAAHHDAKTNDDVTHAAATNENQQPTAGLEQVSA